MQLEDRFYTSTEVAEILGVSLRSVYRYLEDKKLIADVKTATGRHRFTRQNINEFLYPDGQPSPLVDDSTALVATGTPVVADTAAKSPAATTTQTNEEQVDWLAKFRDAATKYKEEETPAQPTETPQPEVPAEPAPVPPVPEPVAPTPPPVPEPVPAPVEPKPVAPTPPPAPVQPAPVAPVPQPAAPTPPPVPAPQARAAAPTLMYYRSMLGGLKDIAQNIDKSAKNSNLDYAFTLNAGASLHKPIKPFATLHAYVKSGDRDFFEKILRLTPSNQSNAQLCLVISDGSGIYSSTEEVHGLTVVSKAQMKQDIASFGDAQLAQEMADVL